MVISVALMVWYLNRTPEGFSGGITDEEMIEYDRRWQRCAAIAKNFGPGLGVCDEILMGKKIDDPHWTELQPITHKWESRCRAEPKKYMTVTENLINVMGGDASSVAVKTCADRHATLEVNPVS